MSVPMNKPTKFSGGVAVRCNLWLEFLLTKTKEKYDGTNKKHV